MRIANLRKVTGFWKNLTFTGNVCKMRSVLNEYLKEEGLKSEITDGLVLFEFEDSHFNANFRINEGYSECEITYEVEDEDYEALEIRDKTFISDRVNTDLENHCTVYTFNDSIKLSSSFYFTSKQMMLDLFRRHFMDLTHSLDMTIDIVKNKIDEHKERKSRRIGFNTEVHKQPEQESENLQIAAKA